jgi:prephenate dehydrogenase
MSQPQRTLQQASVAIIGLGLMGSSLGLALAGRCGRRLGSDAGAATAAAALSRGAVDETGTVVDIVAAADLVVLCTPVGAIVDAAAAIAGAMRRDAVLTDVGSTKTVVCDAFDDLPVAAIGGHPMCGRELSGPDAADPALFDGARWALCRSRSSTMAARELVGQLVAAVGARTLDVDRASHDLVVAHVSHLPYLLAQALATTVDVLDQHTGGLAGALAASGFSGGTRVAGGDVQMWRDILATNREHAVGALRAFSGELHELATALEQDAVLEQRLQAGRAALARLQRT